MENRALLRLLLLAVGLHLIWNFAAGQSALPAFEGQPVSEAECNTLPRNNCWKGMANCRESYARMTKVNTSVKGLECYHNATDQEVLDTATSISRANPNRAVRVFYSEVFDSFKLSPETVDPIKKQVIELYLMNCKDQSTTYRIGALPLSNLLYLQISSCKDGLVVKKSDFAPFTHLRSLDFFLTSIASIEPDTFKNLPELRSLALENRLGANALRGSNASDSDLNVAAVRKIHCDCDYAWLRNWLDAHPYLLSDRDEGELYVIGNRLSNRVFRSTAFYAVDCASPTLFIEQGEFKDRTGLRFSVNAHCK
ncbi:uncharacterized protein LOC129592684 [Paramacrobiotus metropolitanus]|uniref:uncharacterized protein LOC129592684 n=1 Tax=Paramacrobiotus metropolitanus TaxID=2943436 RepID=UPI0024456B61|nr:uncharacterized protein LOC129592684 [Paramacrobiotus metropolitanus]